MRSAETTGTSTASSLAEQRSSSSSTIALPDDVLLHILRLAGTMAVVNATRVSRQWRRVAVEMIKDTHRVNATTLLRQVPEHQVTVAFVLRTLCTLSNLESLSFKNWSKSLTRKKMLSNILLRYSSSMLNEIDLTGAAFEAPEVIALVARCLSLTSLRLAWCDSVDDNLLQQIKSIKLYSIRASQSRPFDVIDLSDCKNITNDGFRSLLCGHVVNNLVAARCKLRGVIMAENVTISDLNLSGNKILYCLNLTLTQDALQSLNLSHCRSLTRISLRQHPRSSGVFQLRRLNLAGASTLRHITFGTSQQNLEEGNITQAFSGINIDGQTLEATPTPLANIECISLFGARVLSADVFRTQFGLSSSVCRMPRLRALDLNGCLELDCLVLVGYQHLESVDCSGCPLLDRLQVADAPRMQKLTVCGMRAPLRNVDIQLPALAVVYGLREFWSSEIVDNLQRVRHAA